MFLCFSSGAMFFIPMDDSQTDHLKAYGIVFKILQGGNKVYWLLNYQGGSFAAEAPQKYAVCACPRQVRR